MTGCARARGRARGADALSAPQMRVRRSCNRAVLSSSFTHTTTTPLPAGTTRAQVLRLLHDHAAMIALNPLVISHARTDDAGGASTASAAAPPPPELLLQKATYAITDKMAYLPFGLWEGRVSYTAEFEDREDGVRTVARAAMGFVSEAAWVVEEAADGGALVLRETANVTCPRLMKIFVEGTMRKSHEELCGRFVERLGKT